MVGIFRCRIILNSRNINSCTKSTATISSKSERMSMWTPPRLEGVWRVMRARLYAYTNFWRNGAWSTTFTLSLPANKLKINRKSLQARLIFYLWARGKIASIGTNLSSRGLTARMTLNSWRRSRGSLERYVTIAKESLESYGTNTTKLSI